MVDESDGVPGKLKRVRLLGCKLDPQSAMRNSSRCETRRTVDDSIQCATQTQSTSSLQRFRYAVVGLPFASAYEDLVAVRSRLSINDTEMTAIVVCCTVHRKWKEVYAAKAGIRDCTRT